MVAPKKRFIIIASFIVLLVAGYLVAETVFVSQKTETIINSEPELAPGTWVNRDEAPEETPPPDDALSRYTVAADQPRALYIDTLSIASRILPMGIGSDGSIQSPKNIFDAGWYSGSAKPGENGAAFLDGHASGASRQGLMAYLDTLKTGDSIRIEKGDGEMLWYEVVQTETVPLDQVDMKEALSVQGGTDKGLTIMTCTGTWIPEKLTYDHRFIVYAQQIAPKSDTSVIIE